MFYFAVWASVIQIFAHTLNVAGTEDFNHPQICVGVLEFIRSARASSFAGFIALLNTLLYEAIPVASRSGWQVDTTFVIVYCRLEPGNSLRLVNISPERIGGQEAWRRHRRRAFSTVRAV